LIQSLLDSQFMIVWKKAISHGIWAVLEKQNVDKGLANKAFLTKKIFHVIDEPYWHHATIC
jgi:hypothetical protein